MEDREHAVLVGRGDEPADLVLRDGMLVNVASGECYAADIAVAGSLVAGIGPGYAGREEVNLAGRYVCPGLIDAHLHIESALLPPAEFARLALPCGVTTVVTDPHEVANVSGLEGIRFMIDDAARSPLSVFVNAPSCVPATPLSTNGASLDADALAGLLDDPAVLGLAEVMDVPAVTRGDPAVMAKIARFSPRPVDGHAPALTGRGLCAYLAAGIESDHECIAADEALEKLRLGMTLFLREATNARNLRALLPMITPATRHRICLCTDDRSVLHLMEEGSIDDLVRIAIAGGIDPMTALRLATLNPAAHFNLRDRGLIAPGRRADLIVFRDLAAPRPELVYAGGQRVAEAGRCLIERAPAAIELRDTVHVDLGRLDLAVPARGGRVRAIGLIPDELVTEERLADACRRQGQAVADPGRDLLKIAVVERHRGSGRIGLGFVQGLGLKRGALAGTVAHDHHNLILVGADDASMRTAARAVVEAGGGLAVADGERVAARMPLPIAGLMSDQPFEQAAEQFRGVLRAARERGATPRDPFMAMSFLGLEVIPALKITDRGLVDVSRMETVSVFAG